MYMRSEGFGNFVTTPYKSSANNYVKAVTQFLDSQVIMPSGPYFLVFPYYLWNKYSEDSSAQKLVKGLMVDLLGIDESCKKILRYNTQSIKDFSKQAIVSLYDKSSLAVSNQPLTQFKHVIKRILFFFISVFILELLGTNRSVLSKLMLPLLIVLTGDLLIAISIKVS